MGTAAAKGVGRSEGARQLEGAAGGPAIHHSTGRRTCGTKQRSRGVEGRVQGKGQEAAPEAAVLTPDEPLWKLNASVGKEHHGLGNGQRVLQRVARLIVAWGAQII